MQEFIQNASGTLCEVGRTAIPNYENVDAVMEAIRNGELKPNDLFTTPSAHGVPEDIQAFINWMISIVPQCAAPENMLTTQMDIKGEGGINDKIACVASCVSALCDNVTTNYTLCNDFNAVASRVGVNETNIADLQSTKFDKSTFNQFYNNEYTSFVTTTTTNVSDLNTCTECLCCRTDALENSRVCCCDYNDYITANDIAVSCRVKCCDYSTKIQELEACDTTQNQQLASLNSCSGLSCTGTVKCIYNSSKNVILSPDANGMVSMALEAATYSLSGNTLTITF